MATGGEVPGRLPSSTGPKHLHVSHLMCKPCLDKAYLIYATGLCVDCQDYLCVQCLHTHKEQQHQVQDIKQMLRRKTKPKPEDSCSDSCPVHENKVIQYYCASHCHLGCKSCMNDDHAACNEVHYIPRVSKKLDNNVDYRQVKNQLKSALDIFTNVFRNAQRNSDEVDKSARDALRKLHDFKKQIDEILEKAEIELVEQVQSLRLKANEELAEMRNKYIAAHEELQSSLAKIEALQNANQNCSSYIEMMRTKAKIKSLEGQIKQANIDISYRQKPIELIPNRDLLEKLRNPGGFGTVSPAGTRRGLSGADEVSLLSDIDKRSVVSGSDDISILSHETVPSFSDDFSVISDTESMISQPRVRTRTGGIISESAFGTQDYHLQELNVKTEDDKCQITGIVVLSDSSLVLTDFKHGTLKAVDVQTGQILAQLELRSRPWDIASIEKKKVAVTMPYVKIIAFLTVENNCMIVDRTLDVDGTCFGVDYRNGKLAVSFINPHKVQILNLQGQMLHSIASDISGKALFDYPKYLNFGQDDTTFYVSSSRDHSVVCVKVDGTVVATYRARDLKSPRKAVVDGSGKLYVCASGSNKVHQITKDCKKLRVLLTQADGLDKPCSICLSEKEDKLYVGVWGNDYVYVYRTDHNDSQ